MAARKPAASALHTPSRAAFDVPATLAWLNAHATENTLTGMARYGLPQDHALGVSLADIHVLAKEIGRDHALALALWETGCYEARLLTAFIDDPAQVTSAQMDRWCRDFDNWGVCDTLCFKLFDQTPHAWTKVGKWCARKAEFEKRAGFALLASLAGHDKTAPDTKFLEGLELIEQGAGDDRNFVKKGVSWALRRIGSKQSAVLRRAARATAARLATSVDAGARWVGKDALREFAKADHDRR